MMSHTLGFLWFFSGFRGNWVFLIGFILFALVVRVALRNFFGRGGVRSPRYNKYNKYEGPKPTQSDDHQEQPAQKLYYGAPGNYDGGSGAGAATVRTDGGVETRRVDNTEGGMAGVYGEPTRPLESKAETPAKASRIDGEPDDTTSNQS